MMSALDQLQIETIQVRHKYRGLVTAASAYRNGDLACHASLGAEELFPTEFVVTHLPTGYLLARGFRTVERAAGAMLELCRARNDWSVIDDEQLTTELRLHLDDLIRPFGGNIGRGPRPDVANVRPINSYGTLQ